MDPLARQELEEIYRRVDARIAQTGVECWLKSKCCDFEKNEHRLYATSAEIAYTRERHPDPFAADSVLCPFWKDGLCMERDRRPLGCRTYFCDEKYRDALEAIHEEFHQEIQDLAQRHRIPYRYELFVDALRGPRRDR